MSCESDEAHQRWADGLWRVLQSPSWEVLARELLAYSIQLNEEVNGRGQRVNGQHGPHLHDGELQAFGKGDFPKPRSFPRLADSMNGVNGSIEET